jgi:deoxyribodipyrimidine photo-lyase
MNLTTPTPGTEEQWVQTHLADLCSDTPVASPRFRGTQQAAKEAWGKFDANQYAKTRNEVWPVEARGASGMSPYIRHGFFSLSYLWNTVEGPSADTQKFRDELLWQEYARHLYARFGHDLAQPLQYAPNKKNWFDLEQKTSKRTANKDSVEAQQTNPAREPGQANPAREPGQTNATSDSGQANPAHDPWDRSMACLDLAVTELESDGWMVNQTRMWLSSHWTVRQGFNWRDGEDRFFTHLLDGSRAANRTGWQWTIGTATGKPYGFSRWQVEKRAPELCATCPHQENCPVQEWPPETHPMEMSGDQRLRHDADAERTAGPLEVEKFETPDTIWLTAEMLGDCDPALTQHPDLPIAFVFDEPLLSSLQLSGKRLIFIAERLAELGQQRTVEVFRGNPVELLAERALAATFSPVPGWRRRATLLQPAVVHPWPWLRTPTSGPINSFSAWRNSHTRKR